jgi:hypothetical protein
MKNILELLLIIFKELFELKRYEQV